MSSSNEGGDDANQLGCPTQLKRQYQPGHCFAILYIQGAYWAPSQ